jgi:hypothetical protein
MMEEAIYMKATTNMMKEVNHLHNQHGGGYTPTRDN